MSPVLSRVIWPSPQGTHIKGVPNMAPRRILRPQTEEVVIILILMVIIIIIIIMKNNNNLSIQVKGTTIHVVL